MISLPLSIGFLSLLFSESVLDITGQKKWGLYLYQCRESASALLRFLRSFHQQQGTLSSSRTAPLCLACNRGSCWCEELERFSINAKHVRDVRTVSKRLWRSRFGETRWFHLQVRCQVGWVRTLLNPLNPELNPICHLLALLRAHHFLHVSRIRVKLLTFKLLMSYIYIYIYIYGAPILDVSRSHTTTQHSR